MDVLFFFYGLAFFTLGVTVLAQPRRENSSELVRCLWLLGVFGILHGFCEWVHLLELSGGAGERYLPLHIVLGGGSFLCLFEFGRRLLRIALRAREFPARLLRWVELPGAYVVPLLGAAGYLITPGPALTGMDVWIRYGLALPGALAAGAGFLILSRTNHREAGDGGPRTFRSLAYILFAYALLSAVVPPAPFFPAQAFNLDAFRAATGIPVQAPRAAVAWIMALAVGSLFHLIHRAARRKLKDAVADANRLRERSDMVLETTDDAICGVDRRGRITFANPAAGVLLGCPPEQLLGRRFSDFRVTRTRERPTGTFPSPAPLRSDREYFVRTDGDRFAVEYSSTPRFDRGQLTCAIVAFRDITERRENERAERWEQQQRFQAVFEQAAVGMALVGMDGVCLQANDRLCRILRQSPENVLNAPFDRFIHRDDQDRCMAAKNGMVRDLAAGSNVMEVRCGEEEAQTVWVQLALSLVRDRSGAPMYCVLVVDDITERKEAETALLRSQADLERSQRIARLGSWELELDHLQMHWSKEALRVLGRTVSPPDLREFLSAAHPGDYEEVAAAVEGWFAGRGRRSLEFRIVRPDQEQRYVDLSVRFEYGPDGAPSRAVGTIQDITERKRTEQVLEFYRNRLEQLVEERTGELRASNRELASANRELEAFSYSVSHDLRSPLRAINGFTQALQEDYGDRLDDDALGYIRRVQSATVRMGELIDGLLNLSRVFRSELECEAVDLSALAAEIVRQMRAAEPQREVTVEIEPGLSAMGDRTLLRLLLQNLIGNAWKFSADEPDARLAFGQQADEEGSRCFFVRDNGVGFEMEYAHQLFQPFHRLHAHDEYDGTGIGLATVRRIVQRHGGHVRAEGKPGEGATIYFTLEPGSGELPAPVRTAPMAGNA